MKRLFFALIIAISIHAALLSLKNNFSTKPETLLKSEPIKITMSYRHVKKKITSSQPEIIEPFIKKTEKQVLVKKPPAEKKFKPDRKKQLAPVKKIQLPETIKEPDQEPEPEPDPKPALKPALKKVQTTADPPPEQNKILNQEQESESEPVIDKSIENRDKSLPSEKRHNPAVIHTRAVPKYKTNPKLVYPQIAKKRGYQGKVLLLVIVSKTGTAKKVSISKSSGYKLLDKAARKAVSQWLFYPGTRDEEPVEMSVEVPIRFNLK